MTEWNMDRWKFFDITHRNHLVCNPTSSEKLDELVALTKLDPGSRVLDIACGKGEFLVRLVEAYDIHGVGVDLSPYTIEDARRKKADRLPDGNIEFVHMEGADYVAGAGVREFDLTSCMGASWVWKGHRGTLRALKAVTKPGGLVLVGEPYWIKEPTQEYLDAEEATPDDFSTHHGNVQVGEGEGLTLLYTLVTNADDWDRYVGLGWHAADEYANANPDDPDLPEILERVSRDRDIYLRWGRDTLGWALYLFRNGEV